MFWQTFENVDEKIDDAADAVFDGNGQSKESDTKDKKEGSPESKDEAADNSSSTIASAENETSSLWTKYTLKLYDVVNQKNPDDLPYLTIDPSTIRIEGKGGRDFTEDKNYPCWEGWVCKILICVVR